MAPLNAAGPGWRTVEPGQASFNDLPCPGLASFSTTRPALVGSPPFPVGSMQSRIEEAEMPVRTADAVWTGNLQEGTGRMRFGGGAFEGKYSFSSRFEEGEGTNPEELIAAAQAGCYSMQLSSNLGKAGLSPDHVTTTAVVHLDKGESGFSITRIEMTSEARVDGIDDARFQEIVQQAKDGCLVSGALSAVGDITVTAKLV
jgi:osmotically inducible protein OsmC